MITALTVAAALALDARFGEVRRFHPLVGFGRLAQGVERRLYGNRRAAGIAALLLVLLPFTALTLLTRWLPGAVILDTLLLYVAIGWRSLGEHGDRVRIALGRNDLSEARRRLGDMVSRDTRDLDHREVAGATVESLLENGNDAIFGAIFWFLLAGAPGLVLYRLANTLDAMWGYADERYRHFGWAAARLDDALNWAPARLTALSYALLGRTADAIACWRRQAPAWKSPNAGPVMAAGAGSLGVTLGGAARYGGALQRRPELGRGALPTADHIHRARRLVTRSLLLWLVVLFIGEWIVQYAHTA